jgi:hypothetical protein
MICVLHRMIHSDMLDSRYETKATAPISLKCRTLGSLLELVYTVLLGSLLFSPVIEQQVAEQHFRPPLSWPWSPPHSYCLSTLSISGLISTIIFGLILQRTLYLSLVDALRRFRILFMSPPVTGTRFTYLVRSFFMTYVRSCDGRSLPC